MNQLVLIGRTTDELERKVTTSGKSVVSFNIAVKRPYNSDVTDFFRCVAWEKTSDLMSQYVKKGDKIGITGILTTRSWTTQSGEKRSVVEILVNSFDFCGEKEKGEKIQFHDSNTSFEEINTDDDLPF